MRGGENGQAIKRRRRGRPIAWGVSPRWWRAQQDSGALKGRQIAAAALTVAITFQLSVAVLRLGIFSHTLFLGLLAACGRGEAPCASTWLMASSFG